MIWRKIAVFLALSVLLTFALMPSLGCGIGQVCEPYRTAENSGEITQSNLSWELISPDADKDCHAEFTFEYGWSNADRAKNESDVDPALRTGRDINECAIYYEFRTDSGVFPAAYPTKVVENGKVFWRATLNIGAKNEAINPTHYRIWVSAVNRTSPLQNVPADYYDVWVKGNIDYSPY